MGMVADAAQRHGWAAARGQGWAVALGRLLLALTLALAAAVAMPTSAYACSCATSSPDETADRADAIFSGVVRDVSKERGEDPPQSRLIMDTTRVYKGDVYAEQTVFTPIDDGGGTCGIDAEPGTSWVIFGNYATSAEAEEASVTTDICRGSTPAPEAPNDLGPARPPLDGSSAAVGRAERIDDMVSTGMKAAGLTVLGLLALAGLGLAVVWRPRSPGR